MELSKSIGTRMAAASQLEKAGSLVEAAAIYQKLFDANPTNKPVIARLLIIYRKLKEYKKELSILNDAIAAYKLQQKTARDQWIQSHPKAASAGKSMLRQLEKAGGAGAGMTGAPSLEGWLKRKQLVTQRITGKKAKVIKLPRQSQVRDKQRQLLKETRQQLKKEKQQQLKEDKQHQLKEAKQRQLKEAQAALPSLFLILLTYRVSLNKIDAAMKQHMTYLTKHYDNSDFLVSGRQIPRTGGVILARASNRAALEKIVSQDPFIKRKLATADIIEFNPSQMASGLKKWLTPNPAK